MAFRLKHRAIARELRRLVRNELDAAIKRLEAVTGEPDIHRVRKSIKKVRAIVKLLRAPLGSSYATENARLRAAGVALAPLRDADAMLQTVEALCERYPNALVPALKEDISHELQRRRRDVRRRSRAMTGQALRKLELSRETLPGRIADAGEWPSVRSGLVRVYKRSRSTLADLKVQSSPVAFHAWRRRVKEHWYHVRLFEAQRSEPRARARRLKELESALGDAHNLALLGKILREKPDRFGGGRTTAIMLGYIEKRQRALRRQALMVGHRMFASKPKKFGKTIAPWWHRRAGA